MTTGPLRLLRLLILALTAACAACALPKTTPVKPPPDGGMAQRAFRERPKGLEYVAPQLAIGQEGTLYLLWLAAEWHKSWDILFSRSEDFGATWSQPPISLKPEKATVAGGHRIATGPNGKVYVVWREWDPKIKIRHLQFVRSQDHGVHWDEPSRLLSASNDLGVPQLLADQDGGVSVASLVEPRSHRSLEVAISHDFGATFPSTPIRLTAAFPTSEYGITNHRFASDGRGHLYAVWEEIKAVLDYRIYLNRSLDRGTTWGPQPILVSTPEEGEHRAHSPQIITAPEGRVYVAWEQDEFGVGNRELLGGIREADRFIYVNRSLDYGLTWLPQPVRLNLSVAGQGPVQSLRAQLSADQHGNVYAIWLEEEGPRRERLLFTRSTDFGMTWNAPRVRLDLSSPFKGWVFNPEIRSDDAGHVWVLWQELAPGQKGRVGWQLLINRSEDHGESWRQQATALTGPAQRGGRFRGVSFLSDGRGRLYVAWNEGPENSEEIYFNFNRSTDFGATWLSREVQVGRR